MKQMQSNEHAERMATAIEYVIPCIQKLIDIQPYSEHIGTFREHLKELQESSAAWRKRK